MKITEYLKNEVKWSFHEEIDPMQKKKEKCFRIWREFIYILYKIMQTIRW